MAKPDNDAASHGCCDRPAPGSITIRPSREDAEDSEEAFYRLYNWARLQGDLSAKTIREATGQEISDAAISKMGSQYDNRRFTPQQRAKLLDHIFQKRDFIFGKARQQVREIDDAFYFAFLNYFEAKSWEQDFARARIIGTYKLWRFSVEHEGEFVFGRLDFEEPEDTHVVRVKMFQPMRTREGVREISERATGYLFGFGGTYIIVLRDRMNNDLRVSVWPHNRIDFVGEGINPKSVFSGVQKHIVQLDGFALGIDGSVGFFSPVYLSLVDDVDELARLDSLLDIISEDDERVPKRVVGRLKRNGPMKRL